MSTQDEMKAVVVDPDAPGRLSLSRAPAPSALPNEALVRVAAISPNRGEVKSAQAAEIGFRPGWDFAGTVEERAADGSGPAEGNRVVGTVGQGAWSEYVAAPTRALAALPEETSFGAASTLPIAGLTALHAVERYGKSLLGRRVLVSGASGGAGNFAVQLATLAGAQVVGLIRNPDGESVVREAGAKEVVPGGNVSDAREFGPYDLAIDSVGGDILAGMLSMLAPEGACVTFGASASSEVTFDAQSFFLAGGARLYGIIVFYEMEREPAGIGLSRLANLVAEQKLRPHIGIEESWENIGEVTQNLLDRSFAGKAVLHVDPQPE